MPLSDHEQRLLAQMEQQLLDEDPRFASTMRGAGGRASGRRRLLIGGVAVVAGLVMLVLSVASSLVPLGVVAFLLMLGGAIYAMSSPRHTGPTGVVGADGRAVPRGKPAGGRAQHQQRRGTFMQRMEQRWEKRRDERGR